MLPFLQSFLFSSNKNGSIVVNKIVKADFINSDKRFSIVFFGYVGCTDVCTPLLKKLNSMYSSKKFDRVKDDTNIIFVNLTDEVEKYQPDLFAKFFNEHFTGVYMSKEEIFSIDRLFGLFFSRSISDESQMNHTDYLYLIENHSGEKILKKMYNTHPLNADKIVKDILKYK